MCFVGVTLGVFAIASGPAATSLGTTTGMTRYARFAALVAVTIALSLFTGVLCTLFGSPAYTTGTTRYARFGALVAVTIALSLFTGALCTLFGSPAYSVCCTHCSIQDWMRCRVCCTHCSPRRCMD